MDITPRHREAETGFRALLANAGIEPPDAVEYGFACVRFFWTGPKLAVIVDLDDAETPVVVNGSPGAG
jgi:hypothetical protein